MTFGLAFDLQGQAQGQSIWYRISSRNNVITCTQMVSNDSLSSLHNLNLRPGIWLSRSNSRSKDGVPDVIPKLHQQVYQMTHSLHGRLTKP